MKFKKIELDFFNYLKIKHLIHHRSVSDNELSVLYHQALCFIFPSYYEGFGIPILEAFSCECPVLASNISSLVEIASDAAIYFDPKDKISILNSLDKMINANKSELIKKGIERLNNFSWKKSAKQTYEIYQNLI